MLEPMKDQMGTLQKTLPCQFNTKSQYKSRRPQHLFHKKALITIAEECIPNHPLN